MRYSRGNRGGKSRQWGVRRYDVPRTAHKARSKTTALIEDVYFVPTEDGEVLRHDLVCRECGARSYASSRALLVSYPCCLHCDRPWEQPVQH